MNTDEYIPEAEGENTPIASNTCSSVTLYTSYYPHPNIRSTPMYQILNIN